MPSSPKRTRSAMPTRRKAAWRLAALFAVATTALAHAFLDHASPAVGSTVREPPREVRLWFSERLEPTFSSVRVLDANGRQVDRGDVRIDAADPGTVATSMPPLAPGIYRVVWRVVSVDTHVTEGDFTFEIAPP